MEKIKTGHALTSIKTGVGPVQILNQKTRIRTRKKDDVNLISQFESPFRNNTICNNETTQLPYCQMLYT